MNSRITIEVNFEDNNRPVIQILQRKSDDVRDNLLSSFLQSLHGSSWLNISCIQNVNELNDMDKFNRWFIRPIPPEDFAEQAFYMLHQYKHQRDNGLLNVVYPQGDPRIDRINKLLEALPEM